MGDAKRFRLFADLISSRFDDRKMPIADIAAGKGQAKAALFRLGYRNVTAWDKRHRLAKPRPGQKFQLFDYRNAPRGYRLAVAMHPDEASDHTVLYAAKHGVPFVLCPCCIKPSAAEYKGRRSFDAWNRHLIEMARCSDFRTEVLDLPMRGRNVVIIGTPNGRR